MDLRNECVVLESSPRQISIGDISLSELVSGLPCFSGTSSGATPCLSKPQRGWTFIVSTGTGLDRRDCLIGLFTALLESTANSFLIVDKHTKACIDARANVFLNWAPANSEVRSNAELRAQRLVKIKAAFGMSNSDLARICRISRTQLYKWLSSDESLQLTPANWQRLGDLERIAQDWNELTSSPARDLLNERIHGRTTLISLLASQKLDNGAIRAAIEKLAKTVSSHPLRRDERLHQRGVQPKPLLGELARDD